MKLLKFLSTLPARGATLQITSQQSRNRSFLSTLPARGATKTCLVWSVGVCISIHAPREGSDRGIMEISHRNKEFLSTLPARGATSIGESYFNIKLFLSTLPARGATRTRPRAAGHQPISIHAPREGSDFSAVRLAILSCTFLSTLPARGATNNQSGRRFRVSHFYPRSPRGERPPTSTAPAAIAKFLSTLPARGATSAFFNIRTDYVISIHAPREGSDEPEAR